VTAPIRKLINFSLGKRNYMQIRILRKFNANEYLKLNPDVAESGMDPYEHYKSYGKVEGRQLHSSHAPKITRSYIKQSIIGVVRYLYRRLPVSQNLKNRIRIFSYQKIPFILRGVPSYEFWLERNNKFTSFSSSSNDFVIEGVDWRLMLPATAPKSKQGAIPSFEVDIIVPVYRGLDQTRRCINSVLNSTVVTPFRLILINDASPEIEVTEYLRSLTSTKQVIVVENEDNLGFTATVNRGMMWSEKNDVLLLNSDAEVANDWLDKLKDQAYSGTRVSSVTPFSNNATICNYPTLAGMKELPQGESLELLDAAFASANREQNIEIPTAIGFCMYIRRDCLNEVGLFDVETFGKGYGEENDFCLRATAKGWKHLLAADTFAFHEGEVSFQAGSNPRKELAIKIIRERYPAYEADVARHIAKNEAYPLRIAATAARFRQGKLPVVLHILHAHGGGTEKQVEDLCRIHQGRAKLLIMTPPFIAAGKDALQLRSADPVDFLDIHLSVLNIDFLISLIQSFGVSLVHIHHVLGYPFNLQNFVQKLGVPFYTTIHDYNFICPHIHMMPVARQYCGEPEPCECNQCLSVDYPQGNSDIIWWRESHAWLFNDAAMVICPSHDTARRCLRYFPNAVYRVVAHEAVEDGGYAADISVPAINENEPLRVAILGVLARHKGKELIAEVLQVSERAKAPLQFKLIGYADSNMPSISSTLFTQTGAYKSNVELIERINTFDPHLILFSAYCPETYSYTLTESMQSKRPVMVPNLGAFPERVAQRPWTWLIDWNIEPTALVSKLCDIRVKNFIERKSPTPPQKNEMERAIVLEDNDFYEKEYLSIGNEIAAKEIIDIRTKGKITALVLIENAGVHPSPCAYIRLILPLIRERGEKFDLCWVTPEQVNHYVADVLITQRTAVTSIAEIDDITAHCRNNNILIVYDLDDLLLMLPDDHPEKTIYAPKSAAVFRWLLEADEVWVSTDALQKQVCHINPRTHVISNYIDDKLWIKPKSSGANRELKDPVQLLYMGTQTHAADFELVKAVLKRLKNEFAERIEINLIGISPNASSEKWFNTIVPPQEIGAGYPAFVNWICNEPTFDIGIAPLVDNEFNRSKSAIKFMDYSVLGLATVASDSDGYGLIRNGENGFRVKNTDESWYNAIKTLITDLDLRAGIQLKAQNAVFAEYGFGSVAEYRIKLLRSLLSEDVKVESNVGTVLVESTQTSSEVGRNMIASSFLVGAGIEIGALHNPLPVTYEAIVRYVDRFDKPGLYKQYPELRQHNLVDVDFVDNGETLLTFTEESQDFIIANHFLEHCEDPIATLKAFFRILRTGGVVFLALSDKRFTFDKNRQRTSLAHLIRDHLEGPATSRFDHFCEWPEFVEPHFGRIYATEGEVKDRARELMNQNYSIHYHVWEPCDVYDLLRYCADEQGLPLNIEYFLSKDDEMIIIIRKGNEKARGKSGI